MAVVIWAVVGVVRGGKRVGWRVWAAWGVREDSAEVDMMGTCNDLFGV